MQNNNTPYKNNTNERAIGIFDSGVGGLSIAKCIQQELPHENLIYVADTLHVPYGNKSVEAIKERVGNIAKFLIEKQVKAIVIACNTATVNAIAHLRTELEIPIIGVEPAIKPAAAFSKSKNIGILVTQSTAENYRFQALINKHSHQANIYIQPCPGLVELIEDNKLHDNACRLLLEKYLKHLLEKQVDTLVLGCTHYPFLSEIIASIVGDSIKIIETALPVTKQIDRKLKEHNIGQTVERFGNYEFFSSKATSEQQTLMATLWQHPIKLQALPKLNS